MKAKAYYFMKKKTRQGRKLLGEYFRMKGGWSGYLISCLFQLNLNLGIFLQITKRKLSHKNLIKDNL